MLMIQFVASEVLYSYWTNKVVHPSVSYSETISWATAVPQFMVRGLKFGLKRKSISD